MAARRVPKSTLVTRLLQKNGDYWTTLSNKSSPDIDSRKFWEPDECAQAMMDQTFDMIELCLDIRSMPVLEKGSIPLLGDRENRYLTTMWGKVSVVLIFDMLKREELNQAKNIYSVLPNTNIFVILLPFPPGENECRIASDLRDDGIRVVLMCPIDVTALISAHWNLDDLLLYKVFRTFLLGKQDIEGVYEKYAWLQFKSILSKIKTSPPELSLDDALRNFDIRIADLLEHPVFKDVQSNLEAGNSVVISGASSSGKTFLALRTAHNIHINLGKDVWYYDVGSARTEDAIRLGIRLLDRGTKADELVLILDDLQTSIDIARQMLVFLSLLKRLVFGERLQIIATTWPDFRLNLGSPGINLETFDINASQLRGRMVEHLGKRLNKQQLDTIEKTAGNDLLVLRLSLTISNELGRELTRDELAEELWIRMTKSCDMPAETMGRAVLVASTIGQYECEVTETFLTRLTQIKESDIDSLVKAKLIRHHRGRINAGHRSFCALISKYLGQNEEYWEWFKEQGKPSSQENIMLEFTLSLPPSQVWPILRGIHTYAGFKAGGNATEPEFLLAEYWQDLDYLLDKIVTQQKDDPTWGGDASSATFAIEALCSLGMAGWAKKSIAFLRESYWTDKDGLHVKVADIATFYDFNQIRNKMITEDRGRKSTSIAEPGEEIDADLFHENWARGVVLCAESTIGDRSAPELVELAKLVEKSASESGYFYPGRVPWCTARVLIGLGACGRTVTNSNVVRKGTEWLLRPTKLGGVFHDGMWDPGTGGWNTPIETTALCIIALISIGTDTNDPRLVRAIDYLIAEKKKWVEQDCEIDGVLAIEAYSMMGKQLDTISSELRTLSKWIKGKTLWLYATKHADETLSQSPKIAQMAASLVRVTWKKMSADLPNLLKTFALSRTESKLSESSERPGRLVETKEISGILSPKPGITSTKILETLGKFGCVKLGEVCVVDGYVKFDERERNDLKDFVVRISEAISNRSKKRENYLVWAKPGSGKTYLVDRLVQNLMDNLRYWKLDLSRIEQDEFVRKLHDIQKTTDSTNVICLIDEIDSKNELEWPFEILLSFLDANRHTTNPLVWILAGSSGGSITDFGNSLSQRSKGKDLMSRIPPENIVEIPPPRMEDRILTTLYHIRRLSEYRGVPITHVEIFALFYLLASVEIVDTRQLEDFIHAGIKRVITSEDRLKFDDLFRAGDLRNKEFWKNHEVVATQLMNKYVSISQ